MRTIGKCNNSQAPWEPSFNRKPRAHPSEIWYFFYSVRLLFRPVQQAEPVVFEEEQMAVEILNFVGSY